MTAVIHPAARLSAAWGSAPILVFGDTANTIERGARSVEAGGLRVAARLPVEGAIARLDLQANVGAIWVELAEADAGDLEVFWERVQKDTAAGDYTAVVVIPLASVDRVFAVLNAPGIQVLIEPDPVERAAALAIAMSGIDEVRALSDVAADNSAARLRQLSDEVSRIAATLARLSSGPEIARTEAPVTAPPSFDVPDVPAETVRSIIRARRVRADYFPQDLFADPAWDMLLDLLQAEIVQHRVPVSSLCIAAAVPATTALRWIRQMTDRGLLLRRDDPHDGRRVFIEMAPATSASLRRYFAEVGKVGLV